MRASLFISGITSFCITFSSDLMCNKILEARISICVVQPPISKILLNTKAELKVIGNYILHQ